jgi:drug/metabolite transporter (DMT)-like permease
MRGSLVASAAVVDAPVTPELAELEARPGFQRTAALGYAMVAAAASLWAVNGVVLKVLLQSGLSTYRLAELRSAGGAVLFLLAALATRPRSLQVRRSELPWLAAFGVLGLALVQFLYFVGIERIEIGIAVVLQYLAPVLVALWARFAIGEPVRRRLWYGLALSLAGLVVIVELWTGSSLDGAGVVACLGGAVAYAAYILLAERGLREGRDVLSLLAWGFVLATVFWSLAQPWWTFPGDLLDDSVSLLGRLESTSLPIGVLVASVLVFGTFVPFILMVGALRHIPATRATVVAMIEPVVASLAAFAWLGESLGPAQIAGGLLVLAGIGLAQTARRRP